MCGRYSLNPDDMADVRDLMGDGVMAAIHEFGPSDDVRPTQRVPVILLEDGQWRATRMRWGLVPHWWSQPKPPTMTINARSEEAATKPMWRGPLKTHRCLIPASTWFEWRPVYGADDQPLKERGREVKQKLRIGSSTAHWVCFAGLWSPPHALAPDGSCAILTTSPVPSLEAAHDRMPVVLAPAFWEEWMSDTPSAVFFEHLSTKLLPDLGYEPT